MSMPISYSDAMNDPATVWVVLREESAGDIYQEAVCSSSKQAAEFLFSYAEKHHEGFSLDGIVWLRESARDGLYRRLVHEEGGEVYYTTQRIWSQPVVIPKVGA